MNSAHLEAPPGPAWDGPDHQDLGLAGAQAAGQLQPHRQLGAVQGGGGSLLLHGGRGGHAGLLQQAGEDRSHGNSPT